MDENLGPRGVFSNLEACEVKGSFDSSVQFSTEDFDELKKRVESVPFEENHDDAHDILLGYQGDTAV
ncbi:hypothetical protein R1flu_015280 [Riccia fluitans]|uniref:Uncharacterized protein n=1 Tax=Riccia fluitans TaxID=41844 RepID=A0ABD1YLP7_9MARC